MRAEKNIKLGREKKHSVPRRKKKVETCRSFIESSCVADLKKSVPPRWQELSLLTLQKRNVYSRNYGKCNEEKVLPCVIDFSKLSGFAHIQSVRQNMQPGPTTKISHPIDLFSHQSPLAVA